MYPSASHFLSLGLSYFISKVWILIIMPILVALLSELFAKVSINSKTTCKCYLLLLHDFTDMRETCFCLDKTRRVITLSSFSFISIGIIFVDVIVVVFIYLTNSSERLSCTKH